MPQADGTDHALLHKPLRKLDEEAFGADRSQLLMVLAGSSRIKCLNESFGMIRQGRIADYLGPVTATAMHAKPLIEALLLTSTRDVFWDVLSTNSQAVSLAEEFGFLSTRPLIRMTIGEPIASEYGLQFAIADPAVG